MTWFTLDFDYRVCFGARGCSLISSCIFCTCMYTYTHTLVYINTCTCIHTHAYTCTHIHRHTHVHIHIHYIYIYTIHILIMIKSFFEVCFKRVGAFLFLQKIRLRGDSFYCQYCMILTLVFSSLRECLCSS